MYHCRCFDQRYKVHFDFISLLKIWKCATNQDGLMSLNLWYITTESDLNSSLIFWDNTSPCVNKKAPSERILTDCVAGLPDAPITTKKSPFKSHWGSTRKPHLFQITDPNRSPPIIVERIHEAESIGISFVINFGTRATITRSWLETALEY